MAAVRTDAWRPYAKPLLMVFGLSAFVTGGRALCLFSQGCEWLVPLDVVGMKAAQPAGRISQRGGA